MPDVACGGATLNADTIQVIAAAGEPVAAPSGRMRSDVIHIRQPGGRIVPLRRTIGRRGGATGRENGKPGSIAGRRGTRRGRSVRASGRCVRRKGRCVSIERRPVRPSCRQGAADRRSGTSPADREALAVDREPSPADREALTADREQPAVGRDASTPAGNHRGSTRSLVRETRTGCMKVGRGVRSGGRAVSPAGVPPARPFTYHGVPIIPARQR
jgi:hypothetical protein